MTKHTFTLSLETVQTIAMPRTKQTTTKPKKETFTRQLVKEVFHMLPEHDKGIWQHLQNESTRETFSFDDSKSFTTAGKEVIQKHLDANRKASEAKAAEEKERQSKDKKLRQKQEKEAKNAKVQDGYTAWFAANDPKGKPEAELVAMKATVQRESKTLKRALYDAGINLAISQKKENAIERECKRLKKAAEKANKKEAIKASKEAVDKGTGSDSSETDDDETDDESPTVDIQPVERPADYAQQSASD